MSRVHTENDKTAVLENIEPTEDIVEAIDEKNEEKEARQMRLDRADYTEIQEDDEVQKLKPTLYVLPEAVEVKKKTQEKKSKKEKREKQRRKMRQDKVNYVQIEDDCVILEAEKRDSLETNIVLENIESAEDSVEEVGVANEERETRQMRHKPIQAPVKKIVLDKYEPTVDKAEVKNYTQKTTMRSDQTDNSEIEDVDDIPEHILPDFLDAMKRFGDNKSLMENALNNMSAQENLRRRVGVSILGILLCAGYVITGLILYKDMDTSYAMGITIQTVCTLVGVTILVTFLYSMLDLTHIRRRTTIYPINKPPKDLTNYLASHPTSHSDKNSTNIVD